MTDIKTGRNIENRRNELGLSKSQFAQCLNVSIETVQLWELGEVILDNQQLKAIAKTLKTTVDNLRRLTIQDTDASAVHEQLYDQNRMIEYIRNFAMSHNFVETLNALPYAIERHQGQFRKGKNNVPYIIHPLNMACHTLALGIHEDDIIATILLHDVCEDCKILPQQLPFNDRITQAVSTLTFIETDPSQKKAEKAQYIRQIIRNREATITKLIDRCHNVSFMAFGFSIEKMLDYIEETRLFVLPLLKQARATYPEFDDAFYILNYHISSVINSLDIMISQYNKAD